MKRDTASFRCSVPFFASRATLIHLKGHAHVERSADLHAALHRPLPVHSRPSNLNNEDRRALDLLGAMKVCQLVIGPAGSGKSTFCETMKLHCDAANRVIHLVNLDPAAEDFKYPVSVDIRELISLEDAMEECELGPNGGLLFCLEYLEENVEWLMEALEAYGEEDYLLVDCPGQIEAYSHLSVFKTVVRRYVWKAWSPGRGGAGPPGMSVQADSPSLTGWCLAHLIDRSHLIGCKAMGGRLVVSTVLTLSSARMPASMWRAPSTP